MLSIGLGFKMLRPPRGGSYLDSSTRDWGARVEANGGTVSIATLKIVNKFVVACKRAGVWSKIDRVNLFAGDQLAAAVVPLKIGGGNAIDTPNNVLLGDYTEAGLDGGIKFRRVTKSWLDTGWVPSAEVQPFDAHMGYYLNGCVVSNNEMGAPIGCWGPDSNHRFASDWNGINGGTVRFYLGNGDQYGASSSNLGGAGTSRGLLLFTVRNGQPHALGGEFKIWRDGVEYGGFNSGYSDPSLPAIPVFIGGANFSGSAEFEPNEVPFGFYSIGKGLSDAEATALSNAVLAVQKALGRWVHPAVSDWQRRMRKRTTAIIKPSNIVLQYLSEFCEVLDAAGITSKLRYLNPVAGDNLNHALTPLFNGYAYGYSDTSEPTGDSNSGFTDAEYSLVTGLTKTFAANHVNVPGLPLGTGLVGGMSVWVRQPLEAQADVIIGHKGANDSWAIAGQLLYGQFGGVLDGADKVVALATFPCLAQVSRLSASDARIYINGVEEDRNTAPISIVDTPGTLRLFQNSDGSGNVGLATSLCGFSIESVGFTEQEAADYYTAWQALVASFGRTQTFGILTEDGDNLMTTDPDTQWASENA